MFPRFRFLLQLCPLGFCMFGVPGSSDGQLVPQTNFVPVGEGWAKNSVNAVVFRTSTVSHGDTQFTSYYDFEGYVVLAKRKHGSSEWEVKRTQYQGNVRDAHNSISIGVDGKGFLHVAWDHHNSPLRYAKSREPGSLELTDELPMTGQNEAKVTYPQFYSLPNGDLMFLYRDGASGRGDMMLNRYDVETGQWQAVHHPLISGENKRNPYTNTMAVDKSGGLHLSWVWRETPDVYTNHDICFAYSDDGGQTWVNSKREPYKIPIVERAAEVAWRVPEGRELINQTSMTTDARNRPVIATYWRDAGKSVPQYRIVWFDGKDWHASQVGNRTEKFSLSGGGTKRIPISRPQVVAGADGGICVLFRDEERGSVVSAAISTDTARTDWRVVNLTDKSVGAWEPTYDPARWARDGQLDLFVQNVGQGESEGLEDVPPQTVGILEWKP